MGINIAGTPTWHETITAPATGETGNQARFETPFTEVKDCLEYLKQIRTPVVRTYHVDLPSAAFDSTAVGGDIIAAGDGLPTIVVPNARKLLIFANVCNYTVAPGAAFTMYALLTDVDDLPAFEGGYGAGFVQLDDTSTTSTWFAVDDLPAGEFQPRIHFIAPGSVLTTAATGYAEIGFILFSPEV